MWSAMMRLLAALALFLQLAQSLPSDLDPEETEMSAMDAYRASLMKSPFSLSG